jgi:hypothetical protein
MTDMIDHHFPGGNIVVESVDGDEVYLHQDLRDTGTDWFYWAFRVRGAAGRRLRFHFTRSRAIGVRGPAISHDQGETWRWLGPDAILGNGFAYTFPAAAAEVRFSFAMPYQQAHWQRFMERLGNLEFLSRHRLCTTRKGREAEYVLLGNLGADPAHRVAIACRHHCCEMMASYALEGLTAWVAESADPDAAWLRRQVQFLIVPFVDLDGVEDGDQGKGRMPRDHGRDYEGNSLFPETAAIRALVPTWGSGRLHVALDLHCPWIAGEHNEAIYLVGSADRAIAREQRRFSAILECAKHKSLPFSANDFLPFGTSWNTDANFAGGKGFSRWAVDLPGVQLAASIEIPYANAGGSEVNQETARGVGVDLARGLKEHLA